MMQPIDILIIQDRILNYVGYKYLKQVRLVNMEWNKTAMAILSRGGESVRVTVNNAAAISSSWAKMKEDSGNGQWLLPGLALDIGFSTTKHEFQRLIRTISSPPFTRDGLPTLNKLSFHGIDSSLSYDKWSSFMLLLQLAAPRLRVLILFKYNCAWAEKEGNYVQGPASTQKLPKFPALEELKYGLQWWNELFLVNLLSPDNVPKLSKAHFITMRPDVRRSRPDLRSAMQSIAQFPRDVQLRLSFYHFHDDIWLHALPAQLPNVTRVSICIRQFNDESSTLQTVDGGFISRIFPALRELTLVYEQETEPIAGQRDPVPVLPMGIEQLPRLESLQYITRPKPKLAANQVQVRFLSVSPCDLRVVKFPNLRTVSTELGFELVTGHTGPIFVPSGSPFLPEGMYWLHPGIPLHQQFLNVRRLEVQIRPPALFTLSDEDLERCCINLHKLYPSVTCLAIDVQHISDSSSSSTSAAMMIKTLQRLGVAVRVLIQQFGDLEAFELLGCSTETRSLLQDLVRMRKDSKGKDLLVNNVQRLTAKWGQQKQEQRSVEQTKSTLLNRGLPMKGEVSLSQILMACPNLQVLDMDDRLVAVSENSSADNVYIEAQDLQRVNPDLKICLN